MARFGHRLHDIIDVIDRIRHAGVFGFRGIVKIDASIGTHGDVFQQRIAADGTENVRFRFCRQADRFGVAAAFEVEHAVIVPAVFIVANQTALRIGGKGGFAGAGEAKEYRHITFFTNVSRAVHGGNALQR
ncbi:hypothetical protein D3C86_1766210 [compost metagenome]